MKVANLSNLFRNRRQVKPKPVINSRIIKRQSEKVEEASKEISIHNFAEHSSVHGLRYLSKRHSGKLSRVFWLLSLILSLVALSHHTKHLYTKLNYEPVIELSEKYELAKNYPFPAISICLPLFARDGLANMSKYLDTYRLQKADLVNMTANEKKFLVANYMRCGLNRPNQMQHCCNGSILDNFVDVLNESSLTIDEVFPNCRIKFENVKCDEVITRTLTDLGFCYTSNMQDINTIFKTEHLSAEFIAHMKSPKNVRGTTRWTLDGGYANDSEINLTPLRLTRSNCHAFITKTGLSDMQNTCKQKNIFVKIHSPNEIPTLFNPSFQYEHGKEKMLTPEVRVTRSDSELKKFPPSNRECYFENEKALKFFKVYTKNHCQLECLAEYLVQKCGCVAFYMPRNSTTQVCQFDKFDCLNSYSFDWPESNVRETTPCGCYSTCNEIEYRIDEFDSKFYGSLEANNILNYSTDLIYSKVTAWFELDHVVLVKEKCLAYRFRNFIADLGGLLGLFLGCSLLSIIEVFFFLCSVVKEKFSSRANNA